MVSIMALMVMTALKGPADYDAVVERVSEMTWDSELTRVCDRYGLNVVNVTWEDTGRYAGSCWGPNISDLTIQVQHGTARNRICTPMPVIRYPNFHDLSADLDPDHFYLLVGNERGNEELEPVSLSDYVWGLRGYLHDPSDWPGRRLGLWAPRDSVVLVSAQAVFLPIPDDGEAIFNPVLYNYQSYEGDPAVLAIVATREGTSAAIIDNSGEYAPEGSWGWGQQLFFNSDGQRASFTGTRLSDFMEDGGDGNGQSVGAAGEEGLNMVLLIQIPLRQRERRDTGFDDVCYDMCMPAVACQEASNGVEAAVVGHGELEGPYREIGGYRMVRDDRFPIRVTVQFYKATDNGVATPDDIRQIAEQITRVYEDASYVGSLVVPEEKIARPTGWNDEDVEVSLRKRVPWLYW
jgi:hypothetical protein